MDIHKVKSQKGLWLYIVPVSGLELTNAINNEITIHEVTFLSKDKLPRIRRRLGFTKTISEIFTGYANQIFNGSKTYAVCKVGGKAIDNEKKSIRYSAQRIKYTFSVSVRLWEKAKKCITYNIE